MIEVWDPPFMVYLPPADAWEVQEDYEFEDFGINLIIPKGFRCDLASIPRLLWRLIAPFELSLTAPLIHDYLYRNGGRHLCGEIDRLAADGIFREIMIAEGVSWWRYAAAYRAVRMFGGSAWKEGQCTQVELSR